MTAQIRQAAVSISANIVEGHGRKLRGSFVQFLRISQGSLKELETHLLLAGRGKLDTAEKLEPMLETCDVLGKMLRRLIGSLQERARGSDGGESND